MYESTFEIQLRVLVSTDHCRGWPPCPCTLQHVCCVLWRVGQAGQEASLQAGTLHAPELMGMW